MQIGTSKSVLWKYGPPGTSPFMKELAGVQRTLPLLALDEVPEPLGGDARDAWRVMPGARSLGMDQETFKTHLRRIRVKYRAVGRPAPTRRDLYVRAVEDGPLPPPS
jgi:hypothetical protein